MEIETQNLFSISLDANKLTNNFIKIDITLKGIMQQLQELKNAQGKTDESVSLQKKSLRKIQRKIERHDEAIDSYGKVLEQFDCEFSQPQINEVNSDSQDLDKQEEIKGDLKIVEQGQKIDHKEIEKPIQNLPSKNIDTKNTSQSKPKNGVEKVMASFKERLSSLERQDDQKQNRLNEIQHIIDKFKSRDGPNKRLSIDPSKRPSFKKEKSRDSLQVGDTFQNESSKSIPRSKNGVNDSEDSIQYDFGNNQEVVRQINNLKDNLMERIKSVEAQFRQSQNRTQNMEKTVDILERSHQMLKYDFDRTSTSWSKSRPVITQDKHKREDRLTDTRITNQEFYQDKLMELFNEMDQIRKQYFDIQNKLGKEEDSIFTNNVLQLPGKDGEKILNVKVVNSLKTEGSEQKSQMVIVQRQLARLKEEFQDFAFGVNTTGQNIKTVVIKPNQNKEDWKILSTKMYKLRMELQSGLRDMESKITANNDMVVVLNSLETGIEECRLLMKRKVQYNDYEKGMKRVQTRLNNFISQVYEKENRQNEQDSSLAKQPWFCLSCDSQLKNYTAKLSKSPPKEKLLGRKVNPQSHMVRRNQNGRFPSVLK